LQHLKKQNRAAGTAEARHPEKAVSEVISRIALDVVNYPAASASANSA
jgi:hypothetical protein